MKTKNDEINNNRKRKKEKSGRMKECKKHEKAHCKRERNKQVKCNIRKDGLVDPHAKSSKF
jgi:hypothetical protein